MNSRYVHQDVFKDVDDSPVWKRPADALRETFGKKDYDTVNRPRHYMLFEAEGIEVRDVIEKLADKMWAAPMPTKGGAMQYADYVQMMQYLMRFMDKNGVEDLKKARWYLDKMIEAYE
jgi:hypothetical protein